MLISRSKLMEFALDVFDIFAFLVFVWGIVLCVRFFVANPYTVVGASMSPTFEENDFIIVDKISPRINPWERWDVIVFVPPGKNIPYIKRIIGLPGETVKIQNNGVYVCPDSLNCHKLDESYLPAGLETKARCGLTEFLVDTGSLFVMWDNRGFSTDSSCCFGLWCYKGATYNVPYGNIIGKVYVRLLPHFGFF